MERPGRGCLAQLGTLRKRTSDQVDERDKEGTAVRAVAVAGERSDRLRLQ